MSYSLPGKLRLESSKRFFEMKTKQKHYSITTNSNHNVNCLKKMSPWQRDQPFQGP